MIITSITLHPYDLPMRATWVSAAGGFSRRAGCLLRVTTDDGRRGHGDCAPLTGMGGESLQAAVSALRRQAPGLAGLSPDDALAALPPAAASSTPAARCALETALLDLLAQAANMPLARYLRGDSLKNELAVNAALGSLALLDDQTLAAACAQGFSVLKLKVGSQPIDQEIACLHHLAARLPHGVALRLDANRAWRKADAAHFIDACANWPIEMLEEPLITADIAALQGLQESCRFPLALDESLSRFDLQTLCSTPPARRLVLKPPRFGGLLATLQLAERAAAAGLQCIVTSSIDSACGVLAASHLAAAIDNDLAHGLATASWLAADTGTPPRITNGRLTLPDRPGLGFTANDGLIFS
ncbi:MAG: o-succinylbenzoate synthase [Burkholderiales bacterium]